MYLNIEKPLNRLDLTAVTVNIEFVKDVGVAVSKGAVRRGKNGKLYVSIKGSTILD